MYRSGSSARFSDEFFSHSSSTTVDGEVRPQLPTYNPESHLAKKERDRVRSAEAAVHVIPLLLVVCAVILWFFSTPVDFSNTNDAIAIEAGIRRLQFNQEEVG